MFQKLPPLHALAAFEAAARRQSFAKAAQELCLTQSAISYRIRLLERHFGARLFLRNSRNVTLTAEGSRFLAAALDALSILDTASAQFFDKSRKKVRVSVGFAFASNWLVPRLNDFYLKVPATDLEIRANKDVDLSRLSDLRSGEVDVSIRSARQREWPGYVSTRLVDSEVFPVCSPGYREAAGGLAQPADLQRAVLLRATAQTWSAWFRAAGLTAREPTQGPIFSSTGLMLDAAASGQGVALVRDIFVSRDLETGRLVRLFEVSIPSDIRLYAICRPQTAERPEVIAFLNWIIAASATPGAGN